MVRRYYPQDYPILTEFIFRTASYQSETDVSGLSSEGRKRRPMEEDWENCKEHRMYALDTTKSILGPELKLEAEKCLEDWLDFMVHKKKKNFDLRTSGNTKSNARASKYQMEKHSHDSSIIQRHSNEGELDDLGSENLIVIGEGYSRKYKEENDHEASSLLDSQQQQYKEDEEFQRSFDEFRKEIERLFHTIEFRSEIILWQGDNFWVSANIYLTNLFFHVATPSSTNDSKLKNSSSFITDDSVILQPTNSEKDSILHKSTLDEDIGGTEDTMDIIEKSNQNLNALNNKSLGVLVECIHDSRIVGRQAMQNQVAIERILFNITNKLTPPPVIVPTSSSSMAALEQPTEHFSIGLKAFGTCESMFQPNSSPESGGNQYDAWGDIDRLRQLLRTSLKETELVAFLMFCSRFKTGQKWLKVCMNQYMFGEDESDYYSESEN
jgi:hypothetical protein